jgi:dipeptidyl aminopeptidase/acylaminoacyl peptidase
VVDLHGGPLGAWAPQPWLEVCILASAGFAVACPNIRGSISYGRDWVTQHLGHWGDVDAADVLAVVDHLVAEGVADPAHVGLLGFSYGGFLVNWLVGAYPDRFAAAVSENGLSNQVAAWANSDSGPDYNRRSRLGEPLDEAGILDLWRQSPLRLASRIRTPLLLLQAEADLRCPPQDNEQLFLVLRALGRTVEYVLYPEESHTYALTGRPDRRKDRHERMLAWFKHYLG